MVSVCLRREKWILMSPSDVYRIHTYRKITMIQNKIVFTNKIKICKISNILLTEIFPSVAFTLSNAGNVVYGLSTHST